MKMKLLVAAALGATALLGTVGCTAAGTDGHGADKPAVVKLDASWAQAYPSVSEMSSHADAVVVGSVTKVLGTTVKGDVPYTDFAYHVDTWIKPVATPSADIQIHQTGGTANDQYQEISGDPLLTVGEHSVLYLRQYEPGKYLIMGGPTGRLLVTNGKVAALPEGIARDGLPASVSQFTATAQALAAQSAQ